VPIEYLRELASRMAGNVDLIVFAIGSRVVAFGWCLRSPSSYYMLYAGLDYALNDELDLYFNLHYAALDRALRKQVATIELGVTAGAFKARLGCYSEPSYFFAKGLTPLMSLLLRYGGNLLVPKQPAVPAFEVFSSGKNSA
jgi:predicted N-acyltransferase